MGLKELSEKYLSGKSTKLIAAILAACVLLVASSSFSGANKTDNTALEKRLSHILSEIDGVESVTVMINGKNNQAEGVIIVAQGAENPAVRKKISDAAIAALGVSSHKVEVFSKKGGK